MPASSAPRVLRSWTPSHYMKFGAQRLRPALDLLQAIQLPSTASDVVDLGCGPGNLTPFLRERWPDATIQCVDASQSMLTSAKESHVAQGLDNVEYVQGNFESFHSDAPIDVIYSNAALHWVSFDVHRTLLPRLLSFLKPGGVLAFQMPDTRQQPSHVLMGEAAKHVGFDVSKVRWVTTDVNADAYYNLLRPLASEVHLWSTEYVYQLAGGEGVHPVVDFVSSSGLGPYVDALTPSQRPVFMDTYKDLIATAYPRLEDGTVLLPYKRFFCVVVR
ncbi:hypothetical protein H310_11379 [Aphanomyces invadans]|uniref:Methyltransferase domain-containing protein n=1 Tax=Aphanomyces invadans TaxID=157072 RepID=A0A024TN85_9STRA|nr:hypothetical protein H310_11379 [Aphanomyces invadans]ETV95096.1 hypothetical protein H310_11379 [Aphanomyces invadans]|eukprot:XP_008876269.1 hypothetical protein H310_11379 [Aphanomyces invadans]